MVAKKLSRLILFTLISIATLISESSFAAFTFPTQLDANDRQKILGVFGFGVSAKPLTVPYPLGGYQGVEMSIAGESLDTREFTGLGNASTVSPESLRYPKLFLGKGLYHDVDLHLHFTPVQQATPVSSFGMMMRWYFYHAKFLPANISVVLHGSAANFFDKVLTQSTGADLVTGIVINPVSFYFGIGQAFTSGAFFPTINSSNQKETLSLSTAHTVFGASLQVSSVFFAFEMDRYIDPVYSAKIGLRL
jgi:hypothetical protein